MISRDKALKLIQLYVYVCDMYESRLKYCCQKYSNNSKPRFSDEEILTIYLFVAEEQKYSEVKDIHNFAEEYLPDWFPGLVSYQTFNYRLNRMSEALKELSRHLLGSFVPEKCNRRVALVDSMPVVTCKGRNHVGKVARDIADKGYCSTKNMYYYGLKVHMMGYRVPGSIPFPFRIAISPASASDIAVYRDELSDGLEGVDVYADKGYQDENFWRAKEAEGNHLFSPVKDIKGLLEVLQKMDKAANDLYSSAVSRVREPIGAFFNRLNEKTNIQRAYKCRSTTGLLVHVMGCIAVAFVSLIFNY